MSVIDESAARGRDTAGLLQPAPGVVSRQMGGAAVLIHLASNRIFELNATGARVWALVQQPLTRDALVAQLRTEFGDVADLDASLDDLLGELRREGLIVG